MTKFLQVAESNTFSRLHNVILRPLTLSNEDRLRRFFDLSLWQWFIPGCCIVIAVLTAIIGLYAVNIEHNFIRSVIILLTISITFAAGIIFVAYKSRIPLDSILGDVIREKHISNVLGGIYFGVQVVRWVISLYFYNENSEQPQSTFLLRVLLLLVILFYFLSYYPVFWKVFT